MGHTLPCVLTLVHDQPVSPLLDALAPGDLARDPQQAADYLLIPGRDGRDARNVLVGDDEDVRRRLRCDVAKRGDAILLVDDRRRDLAARDAAEQAVWFSAHSPPWRSTWKVSSFSR